MDTRFNDRHDGVMHHMATLKNLNVDLPIELTEQVQNLLQEGRYFDAHMNLHNFYASHYSVDLHGERYRSDKNSYYSNQAAHANFIAQSMLYPNTASEMGSLGTSSRTIKDAITTSNKLVLTDTSFGHPTTPQDPNDFARCFYYIELVYGYDAALKKAVLENAADRLADSPAWRCIFANWDLLTQFFITRDDNSLSRSYMLLKIISRSHQQYLPMTSSNSNISDNLDKFAEFLTRIAINPEKYGFNAADVLQRIDHLLQYKLVNKSNMLELRKKLVDLVTNQKERVQGLLESEIDVGTDDPRMNQMQERLSTLSMISLDDPEECKTKAPPQQAAFARQFANNNARPIVLNSADYPSNFTVGDLYKTLTGHNPK